MFQQLFCRCIKSYLIAVFRLISYIFFTEALIFISLTFYLPTKNSFAIKNIKIPLALLVCFGVVLQKKRHRPCSFYLCSLWHSFLSVAMYNVIKTKNISNSFCSMLLRYLIRYKLNIQELLWQSIRIDNIFFVIRFIFIVNQWRFKYVTRMI